MSEGSQHDTSKCGRCDYSYMPGDPRYFRGGLYVWPIEGIRYPVCRVCADELDSLATGEVA